MIWILLCLWSVDVFSACSYNAGASITSNLDGCLSGSDSMLVNPGDGLIESGIKQKVVFWTNSIATALSLFAIGAIVYGGLMMTISWGEDEKITKWKDIVKWALIGFLAAISAWAVVRLVVEVIFAVAS